MQVDGVSPGNAYGLQKVTGKENAPEEPSGQQPLSAEVADVSGDEPSGEEEKGVIRLLLDGHYNGVSDVRLRINFNDELEAIEAAERQAVAEEQMGQILGLFGGTGDAESTVASAAAVEGEGEEPGPTVAELDGVAELQEIFANEVNEAKEIFLSASAPSTDELADDLWAAFSTFVDSLWELYPPAEETPVGEAEPADGGAGEEGAVVEGVGADGAIGGEGEGAVAVAVAAEPEPEPAPAPEPEAAPAPDVQGYLDDLEAAFSAAVDELVEALDEVSVLPPLSEPNGNGVAYDKFVAIYNEMRGIVPVTLDSAV